MGGRPDEADRSCATPMAAIIDEQRADMQRIITPALSGLEASMANSRHRWRELLARAHELVPQFGCSE